MTRLTMLLALGLLSTPVAFAGDDRDDVAGGADDKPCDERGPGREGERGGPGHADPAALLRDNADTLGLSEAQLAAVEAIFTEARPELEALHDAARAAREAARAEGATDAEEDAAHAAGEALRDARYATIQAVRAELTEAQWDAARELMPRRHGPGEGRGPGMRGGRPGPERDAEE